MAALLAALAVLQAPPERSAAAFRRALAAATDDLRRAEAFALLPEDPDEKSVDAVAPLLIQASAPIRLKAAEALGRQAGSIPAAAALLEALSRQETPAMKAEMLRRVGQINCGCTVLELQLRGLLRDPEPEVARAAVEAAGPTANRALIMPLILRLAQAEGDGVAADRDACLDALGKLTGQKLDGARAYAAWWKQNRRPDESF